MGTERLLFESGREQMYQNQPVAQGWHERYAAGETDLIDKYNTQPT
jgi:hypothetical protein